MVDFQGISSIFAAVSYLTIIRRARMVSESIAHRLFSVCFVFFLQNLISEARNITDRALQLLETVRGILNRSDLYVSTGQNNYEVQTT